MKFGFALFLAGTLLAGSAFGRFEIQYFGKNSTEATFSFKHRVIFRADGMATETQARFKIDRQLIHLFGPMGAAPSPSVPKVNHRITNVVLKALPGGYTEAAYEYVGTIVVMNGPADSYSVLLPTKPDEIYDAGLVGNTAPCTDPVHSGRGSFWYYWNPKRAHCPLRQGRDYEIVTGKLARLPNTVRTYPEYARLADPVTKAIEMHVFMGQASEPDLNPLTSADENAAGYRQIRNTLTQQGFSVHTWTPAEIIQLGGTTTRVPFVEEFTGKFGETTLRVRLFFGDTGLYEAAKPFHLFLKDAVENGSIVVYNGHSGLGMNLNLSAIERASSIRIRPPVDRYQIFFFNGCSSYPYYNSMYFARKVTEADPQGTRNLDIFTNGLLTYFSVMGRGAITLLQAVESWASGHGALSFQDLANRIDSRNLFGVNGDEDNPTQ